MKMIPFSSSIVCLMLDYLINKGCICENTEDLFHMDHTQRKYFVECYYSYFVRNLLVLLQYITSIYQFLL